MGYTLFHGLYPPHPLLDHSRGMTPPPLLTFPILHRRNIKNPLDGVWNRFLFHSLPESRIPPGSSVLLYSVPYFAKVLM